MSPHLDVEPQPSSPKAGSVRDAKDVSVPQTEAAAYLHEHEREWAVYEPREARRVLRKIDWRLMPLIVGTITIAAVDVS